MYRIIKCSNVSNNTIKLDVSIQLIIENDVESCSTIKPLKDESGIIDKDALKEYLSFIQDVKLKIEECGFVLVNQDLNSDELITKSPLSESRYFIFYKKNNKKSKSAKRLRIMVKYRISDHEYEEKKGVQTLEQHHDKWTKERQKYDKSHNLIPNKMIYKSKFDNIVVDKSHYDSYAQALDAIEIKLNKL